ncbi:hypothetical protein SVAN01_10180 [Stagonosporopsis vannaccii]|nr:hypothetical protein SVAN01_10180 [Stagonosporopsis vannaccii]
MKVKHHYEASRPLESQPLSHLHQLQSCIRHLTSPYVSCRKAQHQKATRAQRSELMKRAMQTLAARQRSIWHAVTKSSAAAPASSEHARHGSRMLVSSPFRRGCGPCAARDERTPNAPASVMAIVPEPVINSRSKEVEQLEHKSADLMVSRVLDTTL